MPQKQKKRIPNREKFDLSDGSELFIVYILGVQSSSKDIYLHCPSCEMFS